MLISDAELQRRLRSDKNLMNTLGLRTPVVVKKPEVITEKRTNEPQIKSTELRIVAGTAAHFNSAGDVAEALNLTENQVRSAKNSENPEVRSRVEQSVANVEALALQRTLEALECLDKSVLLNETPKNVAQIASSMSKVYANIKGKEANVAPGGVQFIVYAPTTKQENHYEVIQAGVA